MKYVVIFCITVVTTAPAIYKKDVKGGRFNRIVTKTEKCDSVKLNSVTELNTFLTTITPEVRIKQVKTTNK